MRALGQVTADLLRKIGFTVDVATVDTATMARRRASKEPVDKGGWSAFGTAFASFDMLNPATNRNRVRRDPMDTAFRAGRATK